jgi:hypothetical protein
MWGSASVPVSVPRVAVAGTHRGYGQAYGI